MPTKIDYRAIARSHLPKGWNLIERDHRVDAGSVSLQGKRVFVIPLDTPHALYVFFHELGHIKLEHLDLKFGELSRYEQEYEAERYAIREFRAHGFSVPRWELLEAKWNVYTHLCRARKRGEGIDPIIWDWVKLFEEAP